MYTRQQVDDIAQLHINNAKTEIVTDNNWHGIKYQIRIDTCGENFKVVSLAYRKHEGNDK